MLKIAILLPSLANTGPIIVAKNIVSELKKDFYFEVFYFDDKEELHFDCKTTKIKFWVKPDFSEFDIIHSHMLRPDFYIWWHRKNIKSIKISTLHQYIWYNLKYSYNYLIAIIFTPIWIYFLKSFNTVVCINEHMAINYKEKTNMVTIPICNGINLNISNQIDISDFKLINELKQKYKVIGVVAELTKRKGIDQVINALVQLPDCALVIVGDGKEKEKLIQLAIDNKVFDRVLFLGYKLNGASYIYQFDIFVMPSRSEGFGLSLIEAITCKKGVICSNIISFKGLFTEEEVTFFELENINSLVNALKQSIDINKTEKAFVKVNNYYTNSIMAANYKQLYLTIS